MGEYKRFCIDASIILGMHGKDDRLRIVCKNFFVDNAHREFLISFEQIGACDEMIWSYPFELQTAYYPFLDLFHTVMPLVRLPFTQETIARLSADTGESVTARLNVAFAEEHRASLLTTRHLLTPSAAERQEERAFTGELEKYYQSSRALVVNLPT